jgi:hypothetical protein
MPHVLATFHIASDVERPKTNGIRTGYAPHHKFGSVDYLASGFHSYEDDMVHYPGETFKVEITFPSWGDLKLHVKVDDSFEVMELDRLVGWGVIEKIL